MVIVLMRHGRPVLTPMSRIAPAEMKNWIEQYDLAVVETEGIPVMAIELARSAACVVASTAPRSLSSVRALGRAPTIVDPVFCEAQLPFAQSNFPRLSPNVWAAIFRLLWLCGYSSGSETLRAARKRAQDAAARLVSLAQHGNVLFVGHGIMNRLIANELVALGWVGPKKQKSKYWSSNAYRFNV